MNPENTPLLEALQFSLRFYAGAYPNEESPVVLATGPSFGVEVHLPQAHLMTLQHHCKEPADALIPAFQTLLEATTGTKINAPQVSGLLRLIAEANHEIEVLRWDLDILVDGEGVLYAHLGPITLRSARRGTWDLQTIEAPSLGAAAAVAASALLVLRKEGY